MFSADLSRGKNSTDMAPEEPVPPLPEGWIQNTPERAPAALENEVATPQRAPLAEDAANITVVDAGAVDFYDLDMDDVAFDAEARVKRKLGGDCPIESYEEFMAVARAGVATGDAQIATESGKGKKSRGSEVGSGAN